MENLNQLINKYKEIIENLRINQENESEFSHLSDQIYLDFAANSIYMSSLIKEYYQKLTNASSSSDKQSIKSWSLFSNPHSHNQSGTYTNFYVDLTRQKILRLFNTNQNEYDVIFVMNATHGLKLLAESFNFESEYQNENSNSNFSNSSHFTYLVDNHTSVVGMRETVWQCSPNTKVYCLYEDDANQSLKFNAKFIEPSSKKETIQNNANFKNNLIVYPAQSNFNGRKYDLNMINQIKETGLNSNLNELKNGNWFVCLDAASYICTSYLDLSDYKPDFLVLSFYKIFGFPTGLGALLVRKTNETKKCLNKKQYFGGGTVNMALIDDHTVCLKNCSGKKYGENLIEKTSFHEFFEDGTISYLQIIGVSLAIDKFEKITFNRGLRLIQIYVNNLSEYCIENLKKLKHFNNCNLVEIYRKNIDGSIINMHGPIIAFNLKNSLGNYISYSLVDKLAQENRIQLRTGCFCNIGACQLFMKHLNDKSFLENFEVHGHKCGDHIDLIDGKPTGAIRISFGYASIKNDIDHLLKFLNDNFIEFEETSKNIESPNFIYYEKQYFKITQLYIYPIKSCGPMKIENSWPIIKNLGFLYDRSFIIVDGNKIPLTQKRFPMLTKLKPFINLNERILQLRFENEIFEMNLEDKIKDRNLTYANNLAGVDQGDEVSVWLTKVFNLKDECRLIRILNDISENDKNSYANKADFLLINENSIKKLRKFLINSLDESLKHGLLDPVKLKTIDNFLLLQFRPNIVVLTQEEFDLSSSNRFFEESWKSIKILNRDVEFNIVENCTRCQMININQNFIQDQHLKNDNIDKTIDLNFICSSLLKQLYKLKSNSKFGIYLSQLDNNKNNQNSRTFSNEANLELDYSNEINNRVSIGDICLSSFDLKQIKIENEK